MMSDLDVLVDEVAAESPPNPDDGSVVITLVTERGSADIRVPRFGLWRSSARNALFSRGDDAAWAVLTLDPTDAATWMDLDPTKDDADAFVTEWNRTAGAGALGESRASRRSSTDTRGR